MNRHRLCLLHPFDPRDATLGATESRVRLILAGQPTDFSLLLVGVDTRGDLELGRVARIDIAGRTVDFLPVARSPRPVAFAAGVLRHLPAVRRAAYAALSSTEVHDFGWTLLGRMIRRPVVLVVDRDAPGPDRLAALRQWLALHLADRVVACAPDFARACRSASPVIAAKIEILPLAGHDGSARAAQSAEDSHIARLYERHRRLFPAQVAHRVRQVAA